METLQRTANRGSISTGNYEIDNSLKFEADNTEIIYRTNESGTNRKTFTTSLWFKRTELGATQEVWHGGRNGELVGIGIITYSGFADQLWIDIGGGSGNTGTLYRSASNQKIRDTSAWYHVCLAVDTTQGTEANRMKVWLNGVEVTSWEQHQIPAQNYQGALESGTEMAWGGYRPSNSEIFSGYLAECHYLDGVAKVQTDFGEYDEDSGIWKPKAYTGTYGNNGCYMKYDDSSALGADSSGNGNTFTLNNIAASDQAVDTPTNSFATVSTAMFVSHDLGYSTTSDGGTLFRVTEFDTWVTAVSSIGVTKGKWYAEFKVIGARNNTMWGIASMEQLDGNSGYATGNGSHIGQADKNWGIGYYQANGRLYVVNNAGSSNTLSWGSAVSQNAVVSVALDMDNYKLYMALNNTYQNSGNPTSGATGTGAISIDATETVAIATSGYSLGSGNDTIAGVNFGGYVTGGMYSQATDGNGYGAFRYAPPTGYYALCTKNLAEFG